VITPVEMTSFVAMHMGQQGGMEYHEFAKLLLDSFDITHKYVVKATETCKRCGRLTHTGTGYCSASCRFIDSKTERKDK